MILRRLSKHVREQNWVAVALDFLIVVLGVFIGVQIGNWNDTRQQRTIYEQSLDRALAEVQVNLSNIERSRVVIDERLPTIQAAIEVLRSCQTSPEARASLEAAFSRVRVMSSIRIDTKALDQLINNDSFLPFQPPETRQTLLSLSTTLNDLRAQSNDLVDLARQADWGLHDVIRMSDLTHGSPADVIEAVRGGAIASPERVRQWQLVVPLDVACKNEKFLNVFLIWEDTAYFNAVMGEVSSLEVRSALETLGVSAPAEDAAP